MVNEFDSFIGNAFGVITGTFTISRFPSVPGNLARLKARSSNSGSFFIGYEGNTGSFPMPWELDAGEDTNWFKLKDGNLNSLYQRGSSGSSYLAYWVMG